MLFTWGVPHDNDDDDNNDVGDYEMHFNVYTKREEKKINI